MDGLLVHCVGRMRVLGVIFGQLGARKDFIFSGCVVGPLFRQDECLGPILAIWKGRKDFFFSG